MLETKGAFQIKRGTTLVYSLLGTKNPPFTEEH